MVCARDVSRGARRRPPGSGAGGAGGAGSGEGPVMRPGAFGEIGLPALGSPAPSTPHDARTWPEECAADPRARGGRNHFRSPDDEDDGGSSFTGPDARRCRQTRAVSRQSRTTLPRTMVELRPEHPSPPAICEHPSSREIRTRANMGARRGMGRDHVPRSEGGIHACSRGQIAASAGKCPQVAPTRHKANVRAVPCRWEIEQICDSSWHCGSS